MSAVIDVRRVCKRYGRQMALEMTTLALGAGDVGAVVGLNGTGKSTLVGILAGLIRPSSGGATILGVRCGHSSLRRNGVVGVALSNLALPPDARAAAFLTYLARLQGLRNAKNEVERVVELLDIGDCAGSPARTLSDGQARRVILAQALLGSPRVLLLDEPSASLDEDSAARLTQVLREHVSGGGTCLLTTHDGAWVQALGPRTFRLSHSGERVNGAHRRPVERLEGHVPDGAPKGSSGPTPRTSPDTQELREPMRGEEA